MASEVQICNLALSRVGARRISALSENTKEARECNKIFADTRDAVLAAHDWGFARKHATLATVATPTYPGWDYAYAYPVDCLAARRIKDDTGSLSQVAYNSDEERYRNVGKVEFEIRATAALDGKVVLTNQDDAVLIYTARVTDPNVFSVEFIDAFAYRLASDLAVPLRADTRKSDTHFRKYMLLIGSAKASSANEGYEKPDSGSSFVNARG